MQYSETEIETTERVQALITERLICFHDALVRRGQIVAATEPLPQITDR